MDGLKTGMSAEVEVIVAHHENVLTVPVSAVLQDERGYICWVKTKEGVDRRELQIGDNGDMSVHVKSGLQEGDIVVINPLDSIAEAQDAAARTLDRSISERQSKPERMERTEAEK